MMYLCRTTICYYFERIFFFFTVQPSSSLRFMFKSYCVPTNGQNNVQHIKRNNVPDMSKLSEVVSALEKMAPLSLAESWDNVGLLMEPDVQRPIRCVFLTNDLTEDVLEEAEAVDADLIVSYHPPIFAPFKRIASDAWKVL